MAEAVGGGADKLPFAFRWIDRRMVVTDPAGVEDLRPGDEVLAIGGVPAETLLRRLVPFSRGDGANDGQRIANLQIAGRGPAEAFDVFSPAVLAPSDGRFALRIRRPAGPTFDRVVPAVRRTARAARLAPAPVEPWRWREVRDDVAVLTLDTLTVWKFRFDWRAWLAERFAEARTGGVRHVVLDLRGNEGGADEVLLELARYLAFKPVVLPSRESRVRFREVPEDLRPHLSTSDESAYRLGAAGTARPAGGFTLPASVPSAFPASPEALDVRWWVLVDESNSSATFLTADILQRNGLATLVGRPTGGNQRGLNAGIVFFPKLPRTGIVVDLPVIGNFDEARPNRGVDPEVRVR